LFLRTPCKQYGIPECIERTDCTFYWKILAWRWSRKDRNM